MIDIFVQAPGMSARFGGGGYDHYQLRRIAAEVERQVKEINAVAIAALANAIGLPADKSLKVTQTDSLRYDLPTDIKAAILSPATVSRIINNQTRPFYDELIRIVTIFEKKFGCRIDPREVYLP